MLCSSCQHQGQITQGRDTTYISSSTFQYFHRMVHRIGGVSEDTKRRVYIDYELCNGLSCSSKRRAVESTTLELRGTSALKAAFGMLAVVGIRSRRPLLDQGTVRLFENDAVHYIREGEDEVSARLEFVSDGRFFIRINYCAYQYIPSGVDGATLHCSSATVEHIIARNILGIMEDEDDNNGNDPLVLQVDDQF
jgi:hypothetical protein